MGRGDTRLRDAFLRGRVTSGRACGVTGGASGSGHEERVGSSARGRSALWVDTARSPVQSPGAAQGHRPSSSGPTRPDGAHGVVRFVALIDKMNPRMQQVRARSAPPLSCPVPPHPLPMVPVGRRNGPVRPSKSARGGGLRVASDGGQMWELLQVQSTLHGPYQTPAGSGVTRAEPRHKHRQQRLGGTRCVAASPRALSPRQTPRGKRSR